MIARDGDAAASVQSSTTEDDESQSLWQSSGSTGGDRGCRLVGAGATLAGLGPLKESTVLLMPLQVGTCGWTDRLGYNFPFGSKDTPSGKLILALGPRNLSAAASYAWAASTAELYVPSQTRAFFTGSRISAVYLPHGRFLTPLYFRRVIDSARLGTAAALARPRFMLMQRIRSTTRVLNQLLQTLQTAK